MKVLLRRSGDKYYVWEDAVYKNSEFYVDGCLVYLANILAVKDDNRKDSVVCAYCGEVIKNTPEEIEKHFAAQEAKRDCFKCQHLRKYNSESKDATYTKDEHGRFIVTETYHANLKCTIGWYDYPDIDAAKAKRDCIFHRCRNAGVAQIKDVFTEYDNPFDTSITVDLLLEKKFEPEGYNRGYFEYDLKSRNTVKACVNEVGVVDHFVIKHRNSRYAVYYSAKYDKLFFTNGRDYDERIPSAISQTKYEQAKAKIAALYKEVKTDE